MADYRARMLCSETANIHNLAHVLFRLSHNQELEKKNPVEAMSQMIQKFTSFQRHLPGPIAASKQHLVIRQFPRVILPTGATGAVGATRGCKK